MSIWRVFGKKANFNEIANKYNIDQVTARIIRNRNMISDEDFNMYLRPDLSRLHDPFSMKDITKACDILLDKIDNKKSIRIIGDYDIDGICSITILYKGLKRAGAIVDYVVPHRIHDGYGINERLIDEAYEDGIDTIITCDNGIAAIEQVKHAKSLGMTIIITDHHDIPFEMQGEEKIYTIPEADACVNPKQADCPYPFKGLCGAVVAYKLIQVLYAKINAIYEGKYKALYSRDLDDFLEFAAIATVGDVMDLINENRVIVKYGLAHIANTPNLGLSALIELCELDKSHISSYHIGFVIGPCLNASGRLESAELAIKMLLSTSENEAKELTKELKALNDERKDLTDSEASKAFEMVDNTSLKDDKVLVVYLENCHESIAGIIAGRVRERYYKPSIVITKSEDGLKGSGRSIDGYNMFEEISKVKSLLTKFGGHPMAAGLSLKEENLEEFRAALNREQTLTKDDLTPKIWIDVAMPVDYVTMELVKEFEILEPFGKGNEKPVFADRNLKVIRANLIGKNKNVLKMQLQSAYGKIIEAIKFKVEEDELPAIGSVIKIIYYPDINEFKGNKSLQFIVNEIDY